MSTALQILGAVTITVGAGLFSLPLGLVVGGLFAIIIGIGVKK